MLPLQLQLKKDFEDNFEFQGRTLNAFLKEKKYMGLFENTLRALGYSNAQIIKAKKLNIIEKCYVAPTGKSIRSGYLYTEVNIADTNWIKLKRKVKSTWKKLKNMI